MTTEEIKKNESELLENINEEDVTLSTSELDNIMSSAEFTNEEVNSEEENLEKYGVWVKVTPEEVTEDSEEEASFELSDLEGTEESELTGEEENLLDELESELPVDESFDITDSSAAVEKETAETQIVSDEEILDIESLDNLENVDLEELTEETGDIEMQNLEDDLDLSLPEVSDGLPDFEVDEAAAEESFEELPELVMDEDLGEKIDVSLSESSPVADNFDDLGALEADIGTSLEPSSFASAAHDADSALILQKIEKELAAIKKEIFELKKDLLNLNANDKTTPEIEVQPPPGETTGFFDEEEDETIALTGDELDNILNTAEITEEIAESPEAPEDIAIEDSSVDIQEPERLIDKEDLIEFAGIEPEEVDEIEINIPSESGESLVLEESEAAIEELTAEEATEEIPLLDDLEELEESGPADMLEEAPTEIPGEPDFTDIDLELPEEEFTFEEETVPEEAIEELEEFPELGEESLEELSEAPILEESEAVIEELTAEEATEEIPLLDDLEELEESGPADMLEEVPSEIPGEPDFTDIDLELPEEEFTFEEETVPEEALEELEEFPELAEESLEELSEAPILEESEAAIEELTDEESMEEIPLLDDLEEVPSEIPGETDLAAIDLELPEGFTPPDVTSTSPKTQSLPDDLKSDIKSVLSYLDQLLESLPEDKIREFADSEYFGIYKKLFEDLGLST